MRLTFTDERSLYIYRMYYLFRWVIFLLCLASVVVTYGEFGGKHGIKVRSLTFYLKYPIYLTYLTLLLAILQTFMALVIITRGIRKYGFTEELPSGGKLSCLQWVYWKLMAVNTKMALSITTVFWFAIFPRIPKAEADANNILAHGCNSIYAVADIIVNGLPYNFSDIIWAICYGVMYFVFTFVYWHVGGWPRPLPGEHEPTSKVIYPVCLDWTTLRHPVMCGLATICHLLASHIILCAFMQVKIRWMPDFEKDTTTDVTTSSTTMDHQGLTNFNKVAPGERNV